MFILYITSRYSHPFTFHILIFFSENPQPNELKLGRKHLKRAHFVMIHYQTWPPLAILWNVLYEDCSFLKKILAI